MEEGLVPRFSATGYEVGFLRMTKGQPSQIRQHTKKGTPVPITHSNRMFILYQQSILLQQPNIDA
jgi:hypothetical protein